MRIRCKAIGGAVVVLLSLGACNQNGDTGGNGPNGGQEDVAVDTMPPDTEPTNDTTPEDMGVPSCNSASPDCPDGRWCNTSNGECATCPIPNMTCSDFEASESTLNPENSRMTLKFAWGSVHLEGISASAEQQAGGVGSGWGDISTEAGTGVDGPTTASLNFQASGTGDARLNSVTLTDICGGQHTLNVSARWNPDRGVTEEFSCSSSN